MSKFREFLVEHLPHQDAKTLDALAARGNADIFLRHNAWELTPKLITFADQALDPTKKPEGLSLQGDNLASLHQILCDWIAPFFKSTGRLERSEVFQLTTTGLYTLSPEYDRIQRIDDITPADLEALLRKHIAGATLLINDLFVNAPEFKSIATAIPAIMDNASFPTTLFVMSGDKSTLNHWGKHWKMAEYFPHWHRKDLPQLQTKTGVHLFQEVAELAGTPAQGTALRAVSLYFQAIEELSKVTGTLSRKRQLARSAVVTLDYGKEIRGFMNAVPTQYGEEITRKDIENTPQHKKMEALSKEFLKDDQIYDPNPDKRD